MQMDDESIRDAVKQTEILRAPKQSLYSFGTTNLYYYLVTEPVYSEKSRPPETVIREGKVVADRPKIVTPYYLSRLEGFSLEARRYFESVLNEKSNTSGLLYTYKNEPKEMNIVSGPLSAAVAKLNDELDLRGDPLVSIIKGLDELWDVSLMKFIYEITRTSLPDNVRQMGQRGLLKMDSGGIPGDARVRIEALFRQVSTGESEPGVLKAELDRWGLFAEYEDRFFSLFKAKR
jgi:hypothetical protein